jgi:hypothetical protein
MVGQLLALQKLHDKVVGTVLMADIKQRADVRMTELRDSLSLAVKLCFQIGRGDQRRIQNLDRNHPIEARVAGAIHFAHSARAQLGLDFIGTKFRTRGQRHWRVIITSEGGRTEAPIPDGLSPTRR